MRPAAKAQTGGKPIWDVVGGLPGATRADLDLPSRAMHRIVSGQGADCRGLRAQ